jgi:hypothetical protein
MVCRRIRRTGATGLEPATSGVTGLFHGYDGWRRLTRYRSIHASLRAFGADLCTLAEDRFRRFATLLLPRPLLSIDPDPMIEYQTQRLE